MDISEKDIQHLRESEEKYRKMIELAGDAIFSIDPESGDIVEANARAVEMTGRKLKDLINRKVWTLHPPDEQEIAKKLFRQVISLGSGSVGEMHFRRPDGSRIIVDVSASVVTYGNKMVIQRICRDVTYRRETEERSRALRRFFEHVLNQMPVGVGVKKNVNTSPEVGFENKKLHEMFHQGDDDPDHLHWHDCNSERCLESRTRINANDGYGKEVTFPDGRIFLFTSSYYRDPDNNWHELQVVQDITDRRHLEDELKKSNEELEERVDERTRELREKHAQLVQSEKMASLGHLVAGVAHEINTPLGALKGNNDNFARAIGKIADILYDPHSPAQIREHTDLKKMFDSIDKLNAVNSNAAERIVNIVRSLRSFARLDQAEMDRVDIHEGLESTLTLVNHEIKGRIEIIKEYGDLPEIECYPNQVNQVFMNILVNAAHAIEEAGKIIITTSIRDDMAVVEIRDTGRGIDQQSLKRIFDPGFTTKGAGIGTGLGLSIAHQIMTDHKGNIEVKSDPGHGTTFSLLLPIR
jgi:PAS domain S-box-containing protein